MREHRRTDSLDGLQSQVRRHGRWSQLLTFLAHWDRPLRVKDGLPLSVIEEAERKLGIRLPTALREWYEVSGRRSSESDGSGESLRNPRELLLYGGALVFYDESQGSVSWGILEANLAEDDPPVVIEGDYANLSIPGPGWFDHSNSVSEYIFGLEITHTIHAAPFSAQGRTSHVTANMVRHQFKAFQFRHPYSIDYPEGFYASSDVIIELRDNNRINVAARNRGALARTKTILKNVHWEQTGK